MPFFDLHLQTQVMVIASGVGAAILFAASKGSSVSQQAWFAVGAMVLGGVIWEYLRPEGKKDEVVEERAKDGISYFANGYKVCYCTDVEGHWQYFVNFVQQCQGVRFVNKRKIDMHQAKLEDIELELVDGWIFVFGGDSCDKGPGTIRFVTCITQAKEKYPDRVFLIFGNRDCNKIRWTSELHEDIMTLEQLKLQPAGYWTGKREQQVTPLIYIRRLAAEKEKLEATILSNEKLEKADEVTDEILKKYVTDEMLAKYNTKTNRLQYFLRNDMGSIGEFEFRKQELEFLEDRVVTDDEVIKSYEDSLQEGGFMYKYMTSGQLGLLVNGTLFVHGQILGQFAGYAPDTWSIGTVPDSDHFISDVKEWLIKLNAWARREVADWIANPTFSKFPRDCTRDEWKHRGGAGLINYGTPATQFPSVVYCRYLDDKSMPIQFPQRLVEHLVLNGVHRVVVGHTPHGNAPTVVQHLGVTLIMGDTSFSHTKSDAAYVGDNRGDAVAAIEIDNKSRYVQVRGRLQTTKDGENLQPGRVLDYKVLPLGQTAAKNVQLDPFVGRQDGKIVVKTESGAEDSHFFVKARLPAMPGAAESCPPKRDLRYLLCKIDGFKQEYREVTFEEVKNYTSANDGSVHLQRGDAQQSMADAFVKDELARNPDELINYLFGEIDMNGNGFVEKCELQKACSKKEVRHALMIEFPDKNFDDIWEVLDQDGDGQVTKEEFASCLKDTQLTLPSLSRINSEAPPPPIF